MKPPEQHHPNLGSCNTGTYLVSSPNPAVVSGSISVDYNGSRSRASGSASPAPSITTLRGRWLFPSTESKRGRQRLGVGHGVSNTTRGLPRRGIELAKSLSHRSLLQSLDLLHHSVHVHEELPQSAAPDGSAAKGN
ncbi:transcriptional adapter 2-alpha [Platysternon megacephalum]|uniref:Transcriptional adapter 2-alpha n=1 Tax=Platysternon megacephalum TaxID=55544 RepID=A0A4D9F740_9SAUR|nr:transcriptional adapter 2-alpha [Platysternon megacephalum]